VVGRVTCSIAAPYDHQMRIIGNRGVIHTNTYREYECPVYIERFGKLALDMRLGEGSGAALAIGVLKGAIGCHSGMSTFAEAGVAAG